MASAVNPDGDNSRPDASITVNVTRYDPELGLRTWWDGEAVLRAEVWEDPERTVVISGNPAGLRSLARHLLTLVQEGVPSGRHLDFDTYGGVLSDDSVAIRVEVEKG
ncbi:Imm32 family immunity protein [Streptomyces avicenniae]|uniref:Imm32 family immunity protein n=1 Tax=Streptomyces avicenniae TaxID=500153 RepID=UPI00167D6B33|nr:hypothetical protein [Streptomyces avicenniae]